MLNTYFYLSLKTISSNKAFWKANNHDLKIHIPELSVNWIYSGIESFYRNRAKKYLQNRLPFWADKMNIKHFRYRIKNQHTLWASCSKKRNLNFNWRIMLLSPEAVDYLIIHELSHLYEMNHSPHFWKLVGEYCPDYKIYKAELKNKNSWLKFPVIK